MSDNYAARMEQAARDQARTLMGDALALVVGTMSEHAKSAIETALVIAFLNGASKRGDDIMASIGQSFGEAK